MCHLLAMCIPGSCKKLFLWLPGEYKSIQLASPWPGTPCMSILYVHNTLCLRAVLAWTPNSARIPNNGGTQNNTQTPIMPSLWAVLTYTPRLILRFLWYGNCVSANCYFRVISLWAVAAGWVCGAEWRPTIYLKRHSHRTFSQLSSAKKGGPPGAILDRSSVQNRSCEIHFQIRPL